MGFFFVLYGYEVFIEKNSAIDEPVGLLSPHGKIFFAVEIRYGKPKFGCLVGALINLPFVEPRGRTTLSCMCLYIYIHTHTQ